MGSKLAIALKLFQNEGFVFYKSNRGFDSLKNPYPYEKKRRWVRGWSKEEFEIIKVHNRQVHKGDAYAPFLKLLAKDVVSEKKKIGGDWIVTCAVPTRKLRDVIKKECNATFIVLAPSPEMLEKLSRQLKKTKEYLMSLQKHFEGVQANEKDAFEVVLTSKMGTDEVVQNVLDLIETSVDKTKPKRIDKHLSLAKRQTRELRLPKIHPTYQPSLEGVRAISGRSVGVGVSYTV